ncbi:hypothetical protein WMY93_002564 [Mugilogobius chulae]|uniref:Uncharacterized protein n=1 Tax=Mugilogobius chulae TaxID=88201 RepID=A0AAW0PVS8_9GOBI
MRPGSPGAQSLPVLALSTCEHFHKMDQVNGMPECDPRQEPQEIFVFGDRQNIVQSQKVRDKLPSSHSLLQIMHHIIRMD